MQNKTKRIVLIETKPGSQIDLISELVSLGYELQITSQPEQAITWICEGSPPDMILLDQHFGSMSCPHLIHELRGHYPDNQLPILVLTAPETDSTTIVHLLDAGANDCIPCPLDIPILFARMGVWIRSRESVRQIVQQVETRVVTESLGAACHHLAQPVTVALAQMEITIGEHPNMEPRLRDRLDEVVQQIKVSGEILDRLRHIKTYESEPYAGRDHILKIERADATGLLKN